MQYIAIRKESDGSLYMDKYFFDRFTEEDLETYRYTKVEAPDDCAVTDFNDDLTFNSEKYNARHQREYAKRRIFQLKQLLANEDYKTIKYIHGELTIEEFESVKYRCKLWRDEINRLEASAN